MHIHDHSHVNKPDSSQRLIYSFSLGGSLYTHGISALATLHVLYHKVWCTDSHANQLQLHHHFMRGYSILCLYDLFLN